MLHTLTDVLHTLTHVWGTLTDATHCAGQTDEWLADEDAYSDVNQTKKVTCRGCAWFVGDALGLSGMRLICLGCAWFVYKVV